jgi:hypothetical protein
VLANPQAFRVNEEVMSVACVDPDHWRHDEYRGRKVLFLIPSQALGNNVCIALFLKAFMAQNEPRTVAVACAQASSDIFRWVKGLKVFSLFMAEKEFATYDRVIDLAHLEGRRNIEFWPVDMEAELLQAFDLEPDMSITTAPREMAVGRALQVGIFPLASSPLRTLPVETTAAIAVEIDRLGHRSTLCLNKGQQQSILFENAWQSQSLTLDLDVNQGYGSIAELMAAIAAFDFVVMADSGPAHMTKLSATPGLAVYTSAPAEVLLGRFENMQAWTVSYAGDYCRAPCGLAKLRQTSDGRVGCMGSLAVPATDLPTTPSRQEAHLLRDLMQNPVPCVAALRQDATELLQRLRDMLPNAKNG